MTNTMRTDSLMMMNRLDLLEATVCGGSPGVAHMLHRIEKLQDRINDIERSVPNTKINRDLASKVGALLNSNSASLKEATAKIELINTSRGEYEQLVSNLLEVKELSKYSGGGEFDGVLESLSVPVEALKLRAAELSGAVRRQTAEVDALLDQYEKAMNLLSLKCAEWDEALAAVEMAN